MYYYNIYAKYDQHPYFKKRTKFTVINIHTLIYNRKVHKMTEIHRNSQKYTEMY